MDNIKLTVNINQVKVKGAKSHAEKSNVYSVYNGNDFMYADRMRRKRTA